MKMLKKNGFTIVELLIYITIMGIVLTSLYGMLIYYKRALKLEESRIKGQQQARYFFTSFASTLRDAGAMLTLANTPNYLKEDPYFNGIWPINSNSGSDGIIVAVADLHAVSSLNQTYNPGDDTVYFEPITITDNIEPGNLWIISGREGYIIFESNTVFATGSTISSLSVDDIVYYSGYLNDDPYRDRLIPHASGEDVSPGDQVAYPEKSMIAKLSDFGVYMVKDIGSGKRALTVYSKPVKELSSDPVENHILIDDIWDMQVTYGIYDDTTNSVRYYCTKDSSTWGNVYPDVCVGGVDQRCIDFINGIRSKNLREIIIDFVIVTEKAVPAEQILQIPSLGDRASWTLSGSHTFKLYTIRVEPRNYNISF